MKSSIPVVRIAWKAFQYFQRNPSRNWSISVINLAIRKCSTNICHPFPTSDFPSAAEELMAADSSAIKHINENFGSSIYGSRGSWRWRHAVVKCQKRNTSCRGWRIHYGAQGVKTKRRFIPHTRPSATMQTYLWKRHVLRAFFNTSSVFIYEPLRRPLIFVNEVKFTLGILIFQPGMLMTARYYLWRRSHLLYLRVIV